MKFLASVLTLFIGAISTVMATNDCASNEDPLCVYKETSNEAIKIYARNSSLHDISTEIEFQLNNMQIEGGHVQQHLVPPQQSKLLTTLAINDPYKPSSVEYAYKYLKGNFKAVHDSSVRYQLPFAVGKTFYVGQSCDTRGTHYSDYNRYAIDFMLPVGTPVHAARDGVVVDYYQLSNSGGLSEMHLDKGNFIEIRHDDGTVAHYHHLRLMGVRVEKGERVKQGQKIGISGNTGYTTGPHLHFAVTTLESPEKAISIEVPFQARRGVLSCPRAGLALKAVSLD